MDRIRARSYTDNVVNIIVGRLKQFSVTTQDVLKEFACLGNVVDIAKLALVHGKTEQVTRAALWEAVRTGLVFHQESAYKFLHDRIHQAAYSLVPEEHRAEVHLRIGRALLADMTADKLDEHLFDVANQLNRGARLLVGARGGEGTGGDKVHASCRAKGQGVDGLRVGLRISCRRHGLARREGLGEPV